MLSFQNKFPPFSVVNGDPRAPQPSKSRPDNYSLLVRVHKGLAVAKRLTQNPGVWISISYHRQILDAMFGEVFLQNPLLDGKRICDVASTNDAAASSAQC